MSLKTTTVWGQYMHTESPAPTSRDSNKKDNILVNVNPNLSIPNPLPVTVLWTVTTTPVDTYNTPSFTVITNADWTVTLPAWTYHAISIQTKNWTTDMTIWSGTTVTLPADTLLSREADKLLQEDFVFLVDNSVWTEYMNISTIA